MITPRMKLLKQVPSQRDPQWRKENSIENSKNGIKQQVLRFQYTMVPGQLRKVFITSLEVIHETSFLHKLDTVTPHDILTQVLHIIHRLPAQHPFRLLQVTKKILGLHRPEASHSL